MSAKEPFEIPDGMRSVYRHFERWRNGHTARLPIPGSVVGGSSGSSSGAWRFPGVQGAALGVRQTKTDAGSRPSPGAADNGSGNVLGTGAPPRPLVLPSA